MSHKSVFFLCLRHKTRHHSFDYTFLLYTITMHHDDASSQIIFLQYILHCSKNARFFNPQLNFNYGKLPPGRRRAINNELIMMFNNNGRGKGVVALMILSGICALLLEHPRYEMVARGLLSTLRRWNRRVF